MSYSTAEWFEYCLPVYKELTAAQKTWYDGAMTEFTSGILGGYGVDLYKARWVILMSIGVGIAITFIYIILMRYCAGILAWISVALVQFGLIGLGFFFFYSRRELNAESTSTATKLIVD